MSLFSDNRNRSDNISPKISQTMQNILRDGKSLINEIAHRAEELIMVQQPPSGVKLNP